MQLCPRFIIRAVMPTEARNKMVKDPNFLKNLEEYTNKAKPEVSYFFEAKGGSGVIAVSPMYVLIHM